MQTPKILFRVRAMIVFFMVALALSGITAFPVYSELKWLFSKGYAPAGSPLGDWLHIVWTGVKDTQEQHPFIFYGFDWLAFAHLVIALLFVGPLRNPIKNRWVIEWGMLACVSVFPLALIAGPIRGIPWSHILIDCSFGVFGFIPLYAVRRWIGVLENREKSFKA